jgi:hypothetical protein
MRETKPFASLSSGLLARKGGAKPAMRPQGFNSYGGSLEDLGWDDMGHGDEEMPEHVPSPVTALTPAPASPPRVHAVAPAPRPLPEPVPEPFIEAISERTAPEPIAPEAIVPEAIVPEPAVVEQQRNLRESFDNEPKAVEHEQESEESFAEEAETAEQPREPEESFAEEAETVLEPREPKGFAEEAEIVALPRRRALPVDSKPKAAFTLRLDPDRHLRLRLASAITRRSAQVLVTAALDDFLNSLPELEALAERVPAEAGRRGR